MASVWALMMSSEMATWKWFQLAQPMMGGLCSALTLRSVNRVTKRVVRIVRGLIRGWDDRGLIGGRDDQWFISGIND